MDDQGTRRKLIYRFPPASLAIELIYELVILRPAQEFIARLLQEKPLENALRYRLFPGLYRDLSTHTLTDALRASTFKYLGYEVGMKHWRKAQTTFCTKFWDYHPQQIDLSHYTQRGHGEETGIQHYAHAKNAPTMAPSKIAEQLGASRCWQDLTGASLCSRTFGS